MNICKSRLLPLFMAAQMLFATSVFAASSYTLFESGQVRPLAMSADGSQLYALNTPDNRLEIFTITNGGLTPAASVLVGLEPVALAVRSNGEVWVVNNVSDSVSIVKVKHKAKETKAHVVRTLLVGDEPLDIVFAGENGNRAFITTAHRGQNSPIDPALTTEGVGRADVWVFDADALVVDDSMGGTPLTIITLFTDSPRALTVSADGSKVYAAGFKTGNKTTTIAETVVTDNGGVPLASLYVDTDGQDTDGMGGPEAHMTDTAGNMQPLTGLIVQHNGSNWVDEAGTVWDHKVNFNLPDNDVFVIDANADVPAEIEAISGVGTIIFNMITNPVSGNVYVTNTEALNLNRFTGSAGTLPAVGDTAAAPYTTLQGHFVESRITVLDGDVTPVHLNKHIDYSVCCDANPAENAKSLAQPMDMAISSDGKTLYVAAFGSGKVGVFDTAKLENNTFVPDTANQIQLTGGGPAGVVLNEQDDLLYVLTRFDNSISIVDTNSNTEIAHVAMYSPEPQHIVDGRQYNYDASLTSSHGDSSCAMCHIFGDMDQIAWSLGNPGGSVVNNPSASTYFGGPSDLAINHEDFGLPVNPHFAPVKGPMTTQSLRGMANHGALHWRGDQTGGTNPDHPDNNAQPDSGIYDERVAFSRFNGAFVDLQGRDSRISDEAMGEFTDFAMELMYPANPIRHLDNSLTAIQQEGETFFFDPSKVVDTAFHCNGCHVVDREFNAEFGVDKPGVFGTTGKNTFAFIQQFLKIPQLRNMYNKVGMFGMPNSRKYLADDPFSNMPEGLDPFNNADDFATFSNHIFFGNDNDHTGDQIKGFGYTQDGSTDTVFRFHNTNGFLPRPAGTVTPLDPGNGFALNITPEGMQIRRNLEEYLMVFPTNFFPIMGQQATLTADNGAAVKPRVELMISRADGGECDLVAHSNKNDGYLYIGGGAFKTNKAGEGSISAGKLRSLANKGSVTYTCTPPGSGVRIALDRDEDGALDGDEITAGTNPADPNSVPAI